MRKRGIGKKKKGCVGYAAEKKRHGNTFRKVQWGGRRGGGRQEKIRKILGEGGRVDEKNGGKKKREHGGKSEGDEGERRIAGDKE